MTDLYHLRARYYDSAVGRFLSRDPYPVNLYDPFELNRYIYAGNNPATLFDPTGTVSLSEYGINLSSKSPAIVILKGAGTGALFSMLSDLSFQFVIEVVVEGRDFRDWISDPETWTEVLLQVCWPNCISVRIVRKKSIRSTAIRMMVTIEHRMPIMLPSTGRDDSGKAEMH